ncbi:alkaline shock response membrane anchor protein AmaP [Epidermidibacterium keratini]|uniref:Alkaline shock response membrane anchor protein AmaP n=1 Tax=Epidermidibacterium keratini TaxID=1891644 RepID=A0A7L4YRV6_9ACTN|nr:alkaline shock response membrane anchor protein AmaP [Epidermidibacterium keratini]QHC01981.1 alkaline shock response membrane anchor protein AmaP [Epidermidibacterium keratini]
MKPPLVDRINRVVLAVVGIIVAAAGIAIVLHSSGALGRDRAGSPVVSSPTAAWYADNGSWLWPTVGVVGLVVIGLCVWWISAQLRTRGTERLELGRSQEGALSVSVSHLEDCIERDATEYDEIRRARAKVSVEDDVVLVALTLSVGPPYDVARAIARVTGTVLPHLAVTLDEPNPKTIRTTITVEAAEAAMTRLQ